MSFSLELCVFIYYLINCQTAGNIALYDGVKLASVLLKQKAKDDASLKAALLIFENDMVTRTTRHVAAARGAFQLHTATGQPYTFLRNVFYRVVSWTSKKMETRKNNKHPSK